MNLFDRYSLPILLLLFITEDGSLSLFLASVPSPRWGKRLTLLVHFLSFVTVNMCVLFLPVQIASPLLYLLFLASPASATRTNLSELCWLKGYVSWASSDAN